MGRYKGKEEESVEGETKVIGLLPEMKTFFKPCQCLQFLSTPGLFVPICEMLFDEIF